MAASRVRIDRLHLAVTGVSREQAVRLAADVARRVAAAVPDTGGAGARRVGALRVRVNVEAGASAEDLAERIAGAITRSLG